MVSTPTEHGTVALTVPVARLLFDIPALALKRARSPDPKRKQHLDSHKQCVSALLQSVRTVVLREWGRLQYYSLVLSKVGDSEAAHGTGPRRILSSCYHRDHRTALRIIEMEITAGLRIRDLSASHGHGFRNKMPYMPCRPPRSHRITRTTRVCRTTAASIASRRSMRTRASARTHQLSHERPPHHAKHGRARLAGPYTPGARTPGDKGTLAHRARTTVLIRASCQTHLTLTQRAGADGRSPPSDPSAPRASLLTEH